MPAENIIAIQETVLNSGSSSSRPSGMRPNLPAASQMTNSTNPLATSANSQPMLCTTQPRPAVEAELRVEVLVNPQRTKPMARAAVIPKTIVSSRRGSSAGCSSMLRSSAGWRASSRAADSPIASPGAVGPVLVSGVLTQLRAPDRGAPLLRLLVRYVSGQLSRPDTMPNVSAQAKSTRAHRAGQQHRVSLCHTAIHVCREPHHSALPPLPGATWPGGGASGPHGPGCPLGATWPALLP